jgi:serine/threonine protein kinase/transcriptional regulator with XRE-family HTH domain
MNKILGDYMLVAEIGEGATGKVFLATPTKKKPFANVGAPLAVKVYKEQILKEKGQLLRIEREFSVGSKLSHPNLVRIHEWHAEEPSCPYLVMEYVDGMPLNKWVEMYRPDSERLLSHVFQGLASGLAALHNAGIIHRDIKPENIMIGSDFEPRIMDFGVVRITHAPGDTPSEEFLGTIRNAAPEWLRCDDSKDDPRIDLYSFGTVLYCLLFGYQVFHEEKQFAKLIELVTHSIPEIDEYVNSRPGPFPKWCALTRKLLEKDPAKRFPDANTLLNELREVGAVGTEPVYGYIATALTGVPGEAKQLITLESHMIANVCKGFEIYLYQPRKISDPTANKDLSAEAVYEMDRKRVLAAGLLVVIADHPSYGVGQELEIAGSIGTPTILIRRQGSNEISRMVTGSFLNLLKEIIYTSPEELEFELKKCLSRNAEKVRAFKRSSCSNLPANLGVRLREMREAVGLNTEEVAQKVGASARLVRAVEERDPIYHNVGMSFLGRLLSVYGRSCAELWDSVGMTKPKQLYWDDSLRNLDRAAKTLRWPASDLIELRDDYARSLANSGPSVITIEQWKAKHDALETGRLKDAKAAGEQGRLLFSE